MLKNILAAGPQASAANINIKKVINNGKGMGESILQQ